MTTINHLTAQPKPPKEKKWSWRSSWAKEILRLAIAEGDITEDHTYDEIFLWHPEIAQTNRTKLPGRVRGLRAQVTADNGRAKEDGADLAHDRALYPKPSNNYRGEPRWQGSSAERLLKGDITAGIHLTMTPEEFYFSRSEYNQGYAQDIFRQHIYQEVKFQKYCLYRKEKKKTQFIRFR